MTDYASSDVKSAKASPAVASSSTARFLSALRGNGSAQNTDDSVFASALDEMMSMATQKTEDLTASRGSTGTDRSAQRSRDDNRSTPDANTRTRQADEQEPVEKTETNNAPKTKEFEDKAPRGPQPRPAQESAKASAAQAVEKKKPANDPTLDATTDDADAVTDVMVKETTQDASPQDDDADATAVSAVSGQQIAAELLAIAKEETSALTFFHAMMPPSHAPQEGDDEEFSDRVTLGDVLADQAANAPSATAGTLGAGQMSEQETSADKSFSQSDPFSSFLAHAPTKKNDGLTPEATAADSASSPDALPDTMMTKADFIKMAKQDNAAQPTNQNTSQTGMTALQNFATQTMNASAQEGASASPITAQAASNASVGSTDGASSSMGLRSAGVYENHAPLHAVKAGPSSQLSVVEQVSVQLHKVAKAGSDTMSLQLRPEELGRIDVKLTFGDDQSVTGKVIVDNPATYDLLTKDASSLQRALQDAGLRADSGCLEFSLRGDGQSNQAFHQQSGRNGATASNAALVTENDATTQAQDSRAETYYLTPNRVNVRI